MVFFPQVTTIYNTHFINIISQTLMNLGIPFQIINRNGMTTLKVEGLSAVFSQLMPHLTSYVHLFALTLNYS